MPEKDYGTNRWVGHVGDAHAVVPVRRLQGERGVVVAQAWSDAAYKDRLVRDPQSVLAEADLEAPSSVRIAVVEDSADKVLPRKPAEGEVTEEVLAGVAAAGCNACGVGVCCYY